MELFKLPRTLGLTADGETITTNVGRFGPYVKYGSKYVSLKEDDPYTITHERALEVIRQKIEADANRIIADFGTQGIQVLNGRYGPYVTDGKKNAKIPKDREPKSLTLEECRALIAQAPERGAGRFGRGKRAAGPAKKAPVKTPKAAATARNGDGAADTAQAPRGARAKKTAGKPAPGVEHAGPIHAARTPAGRASTRARASTAAAAHAPSKASASARATGKAQSRAPATARKAAGAKKSTKRPAARKPLAAKEATRVRGPK
jgi:DNA topoisomerase-1